jgi:hypothetical protein
MKLFQERQPRCRLPFEQHEHDPEIGRIDMLVECRLVFDLLPASDAPINHKLHESGGFGDDLS